MDAIAIKAFSRWRSLGLVAERYDALHGILRDIRFDTISGRASLISWKHGTVMYKRFQNDEGMELLNISE